jgi:hypothetical protein
MLFFAGTRDTLCDISLLNQVLGRLNVTWDLEIIEGGDHSFNLLKSASRTPQEVCEQILRKTQSWLEDTEAL